MTAVPGINCQVNEAFGIAVQLKIVFQVVDFFDQILSILTYGSGSVVETTNQASFYMWWMVGFKVEILASVGGFPVDSCDQCHLLPDDQNIQKRDSIV
jgi:hypothetical protein